jgi:hypothetical protein
MSKGEHRDDVAVSVPARMGSGTPPASSLLSVVPRWWRVVSIWFRGTAAHTEATRVPSSPRVPDAAGDQRWKARGFAACVVALSISTTLLSVKISYAQRNFSTALSSKDQGVTLANHPVARSTSSWQRLPTLIPCTSRLRPPRNWDTY